MKIKIVEAASTMPPMRNASQKRRKPKPMPPLPKVDRKKHYERHGKYIRRIVDGWLEREVIGPNASYNIDQVINALQKDETLINRIDYSIRDGYMSTRTGKIIVKLVKGDRITINNLKSEIKNSNNPPKPEKYVPEPDEDEEDMPSVDTGATTFRFDMDENISINVLEHLKKYLYLFANESWYGINHSAAKEAMFGTPSMIRRDLVETALGKWLTQGWTPMKSSMNKAEYMKDYDMDKKWPEHVYNLRENNRKIKIKIT